MSNAKTKADRKLKLMADFPRVHEGRFANTHRWSLDDNRNISLNSVAVT